MSALLAPKRASTEEHRKLVRGWVKEYRHRGYQPLPSAPYVPWGEPGQPAEPARKKPLVRYSQHWTSTIEGDPFEKFDYDCGIQVMTGCHWGLVVVDLDGQEAVDEWAELCRKHGKPRRTWELPSGSRTGKHVWFSLPRGLKRLETGPLWSATDADGKWKKHAAIERLADNKLAVAPPSLHVVTGRRYYWYVGSDPTAITRPAMAPDWLLALPVIKPPADAPPPRPAVVPFAATAHRSRATWSQVLDAIPDKVAVARDWGLKFSTDRENADGWVSCHAAGREDRNPSASFSPRSGRYWDTETGRSGISLFELGARMGLFPDANAAKDHLASVHLPRSSR